MNIIELKESVMNVFATNFVGVTLHCLILLAGHNLTPSKCYCVLTSAFTHHVSI